MPWIIGGSSALTWSAARDKVRLDLWRKGTSGIPDDVVDRALHASILDIESRRNWQWLENVVGSVEFEADNDQIALPPSVGVIHSVGYFASSNLAAFPIELMPLVKVRQLVGAAKGPPSMYARSNGALFFDCTVPALTRLEIIFQAQCPEVLEDCVETPPVTLGLHQQAVLAGAKAFVALEYLHDDEKAARNNKAFEAHVGRMEDRDDQLRGDDRGGTIQPFTDIFDAAHGLGGIHG